MKHSILPALVLAAALCQPVCANNIQVSNVVITDQDSVTKTANIGFDLSWENSWRLSTGPANWDAAWVFVKYHNGDNVWRHAKLSTTNAQHTVPSGVELKVGATGASGLGAFVYRSAAGSGNNAWTGIKLKWNYGVDGILDTAIITADVQAIEMVHVPQGAFYVGDGATQNSFARGDNPTQPFQVTSADKIDIGNTAGEIGGRVYGVGGPGASTAIYPPVYPNGFAAFYCMKYECSQAQLSRAFATGLPNPLGGNFFPNSSPDHALLVDRAVASFAISYLAWSGLRPMSTFEYEKAGRGPVFPVGREFAWGTAVAANAPYTLADANLPTERVATGYNTNAGNCTYYLTFGGSTRVGMYAKSSYTGGTSARIQSGSSYWGIMDLTGNAAEPVCEPVAATVSNLANFNSDPTNHIQVGAGYFAYPASNFRGSHGDGTATVPGDWTIAFTGFTYDGFSPPPGYTIAPLSSLPDDFVVQYLYNAGVRGVRSAP